MRIALAQYAMSTDVSLNLAKAMELTEEAARNHADLIIFPELCLSPFFPQYAKQQVEQFATSLDGEVVHAFREASRRLNIAASPNLYLRQGEHLYDASLLISRDGSVQGVSKMVHIAQAPGFYEQDYYTSSDTGFRVYDSPLGRIGIVVCFDRHYPESIRTCVLRGAALILIPTANILDEPRDVFDCELRAAAFQNGVFIAMCNRVGAEGDVVFCGESIVVGPTGNVVVKADTSAQLVLADLDLAEAAVARKARPYLSLRCPKWYA
jgi:beta-ureidopropionase